MYYIYIVINIYYEYSSQIDIIMILTINSVLIHSPREQSLRECDKLLDIFFIHNYNHFFIQYMNDNRFALIKYKNYVINTLQGNTSTEIHS